MSLVYEHLSTTAAKPVGSALLQLNLIPGQNCNAPAPKLPSGNWRRATSFTQSVQFSFSLQRSDDAVWYLARCSENVCRSRLLPHWRHLSGFVWRSWGQHCSMSFSIVDFRVEIWTRISPKIKLQCYLIDRDVSSLDFIKTTSLHRFSGCHGEYH
jgi:hypothetical protein